MDLVEDFAYWCANTFIGAPLMLAFLALAIAIIAWRRVFFGIRAPWTCPQAK